MGAALVIGVALSEAITVGVAVGALARVVADGAVAVEGWSVTHPPKLASAITTSAPPA